MYRSILILSNAQEKKREFAGDIATVVGVQIPPAPLSS